ncbi:MAG: protein-L-isoaspartate(D-aspartate) O-methyltransferase [Myxococcales bacterium]|nr:MAG: protein-L-isoaspartate(D-aspartate) O-methyltransferase [Myxococcales bacterium]
MGWTMSGGAADKDKMAERRERMVREQIAGRDVTDARVLAVMGKMPRHDFVPERYKDQAYDDNPLSIGEGQTISQPYIVGKMTELLRLKGAERVLEIGTGSGYQAAILGELAKEVYTIEIVETLCKRAAALLAAKGCANVHVRCGDGYKGWPEAAPFDAIMLTAAPHEIPKPLIEQLKPGGRLVAPVGDWHQELVVLTKQADGSIARQSVFPVRFVPMTGEAEKRERP